MAALSRIVGISALLFANFAGLSTAANAIDQFAVKVVNNRDFKLNLEIRDKVCGGDVVLRDQLEGGESRVIQLCISLKGFAAVRATVGSGCSQVKRMEFNDIKQGDDITF